MFPSGSNCGTGSEGYYYDPRSTAPLPEISRVTFIGGRVLIFRRTLEYPDMAFPLFDEVDPEIRKRKIKAVPMESLELLRLEAERKERSRYAHRHTVYGHSGANQRRHPWAWVYANRQRGF